MRRIICDECGKEIILTHTAYFVHERPIDNFVWHCHGHKMDFCMDFCNAECRDRWVRKHLETER